MYSEKAEEQIAFQDDPQKIQWRLHLGASPTAVFDVLATDAGRARFWAEATTEADGEVLFR